MRYSDNLFHSFIDCLRSVNLLLYNLLYFTTPHSQEYYVSRIHTLITNMIYYLPLRIGEIQADSKQQLDSNIKRYEL